MSVDWREIPLPYRMSGLPKDRAGRPVPWFVQEPEAGQDWDFRVADDRKLVHAWRFDLCWVCGTRRGATAAFVIGPMCAINRVASEPPCHLECATYSARACPFLATPGMTRRTSGLDTSAQGPHRPASGGMLLRNPGVALVWQSKTFSAFPVPAERGGGALIDIGEPLACSWWSQGRTATRAEVLASVLSGLPLLQEEADAQGPEASAALQEAIAAARPLWPAEADQ